MIVGIGTDIVALERIEGLLQRREDAFARRVLHALELEQFQLSSQRTAFLAKRFAAKEAAAKALGTGIAQGLSWQHIRVGHDEWGAPSLHFTEAAAARAKSLGVVSTHLSLSDEQGYAVAFVVLESD